MIKMIHEFMSANPEIKEYVDKLPFYDQTVCWNFYNFLISEIKEAKPYLCKVTSREET